MEEEGVVKPLGREGVEVWGQGRRTKRPPKPDAERDREKRRRKGRKQSRRGERERN
jgi:hypothetical protein